MFLAIINDTYAEVKSDIAAQESEFEITDYFKKVPKYLIPKYYSSWGYLYEVN